MDFSSKLLAQAVDEMAQLPGIGKRTALRMVLHLLKQPKEQTLAMVRALENFRTQVIFCEQCHNLSDVALCEICASPKRDSTQLCVVEDIRDVMAIENTGQYQGKYHVLNGIISPIEGNFSIYFAMRNFLYLCTAKVKIYKRNPCFIYRESA